MSFVAIITVIDLYLRLFLSIFVYISSVVLSSCTLIFFSFSARRPHFLEGGGIVRTLAFHCLDWEIGLAHLANISCSLVIMSTSLELLCTLCNIFKSYFTPKQPECS